MAPKEIKERMLAKATYTKKQAKPVILSKITDGTFPVMVPIKPLSVNDAWKGRRFRTDEYNAYKKTLLYILPNKIILPEPPYEIRLCFGMSSLSSDWDNCIKQFQDVLSEKYEFNDKLIKRGIVEVESVKKGNEFITFEITHYTK